MHGANRNGIERGRVDCRMQAITMPASGS